MATAPIRAYLSRALLGEQPRTLLRLLAPTGLAALLDLAIRGGTLAGYAAQGKLIYGSSLLVSAAFWASPLWLASRLLLVRKEPWRGAARAASAAFFGLWVLPLVTFSYVGQALYHRVFGSYMGRDTVRLGIALRGTVRDWFASWGSGYVLGGMLASGFALTIVLFAIVRKTAPSLAGPIPLLLPLTFLAALVCFWTDNVDSRFLQAATPDCCFVHGAIHALRVRLAGKGDLHQGISLRTPAPLPPLASAFARPPNVVVILTESVRADALCSDPSPTCLSPLLDDVVPDRVALGKLTTQTPNTFSACMVLWTGLPPNVDFRSAHTAPVLWEVARAVGYRTAYVTSQNGEYENFSAFVRNAGIDFLRTATDLGGLAHEQLGAPDERATFEMLGFLRTLPARVPYFALLHLSNTHAPYRTDPALEPFAPSSSRALGDIDEFHNRYRNSVLLQERTVSAFLRELRAMPGWDETVVIFLSDHGEQFREHGGLYHNHSLFDEELRVPGWLVAGTNALTAERRAAIRAYASSRTYAQDVHATIVDLFGVADAQDTLPLARLVGGRSLLRPRVVGEEPAALLSTSTAVWKPDDARYGAMRANRFLVGAPSGPWTCFDTARDPGELHPLAASACGPLLGTVNAAFGGVPR